MSGDEQAFGDVATTLLFENERVRIWEMKLGPGEDGPLHRHELDHILIQIEGDRMAVVPDPRSQGPYKDYEEADVFPGNFFFVPRGGIETARNIGKRAFHEILIELKN
jgi:mannose-6-phosphate isomerase-like protein (cupin superfamily)